MKPSGPPPPAPSGGGPPPPPPPPPAPLLQDVEINGKGDDTARAALFADLNKGEDVTKGTF